MARHSSYSGSLELILSFYCAGVFDSIFIQSDEELALSYTEHTQVFPVCDERFFIKFNLIAFKCAMASISGSRIKFD